MTAYENAPLPTFKYIIGIFLLFLLYLPFSQSQSFLLDFVKLFSIVMIIMTSGNAGARKINNTAKTNQNSYRQKAYKKCGVLYL